MLLGEMVYKKKKREHRAELLGSAFVWWETVTK